MTTWECNCTGDPVGDCAGELLDSILRRCDIVAQRVALHTAQQALVRRICRSCWPKGLEEILWVNLYLEPDPMLQRELERTLPQHVSTDWYLAAPAEIALDSETVKSIHHDYLFEKLKTIDESRWLSNILAEPNSASPILRIWRADGGFACSGIQSDKVDTVYECLFADERKNGLYMHIAYPCRQTPLGKHVGPAGAYLFLRSVDAAKSVPACLIFHLQAFLQAMVAGQLWALSKHMMDDLKSAAEPFALHHGHLRLFLDAAMQIARRVDPLHMDSSEIYALKNAARHVFEAQNTDRSGLRFHSFTAISSIQGEDKQQLDVLLKKFGESVTTLVGESSLARLLVKALNVPCIKTRWLLARSCYKLTISVGLLDDCANNTKYVVVPYAPPGEQSSDEGKKQAQLIEQYLASAALQLARWKEEGFVFHLKSNAILITPPAPSAHEADLHALLRHALDYVEHKRRRADGGGNKAREWAMVLRGLAGIADEWATFAAEVSVVEGAVSIPFAPGDQTISM